MDTFLEVDSVIHSYDDRAILSDVYLKCIPGDIIAVVGINGSGKSTLLDIIIGIRKAERSFIRINNTIIDDKAYKTGLLSFLPQTDYLPKNLNVKKVVELYLDDSLDFFEDDILNRLQNVKIGYLSGGEIRYLEIKLILNSNSPFILLDEPFNGLSPLLIETVTEWIIEADRTKGIIIIDHNIKVVHKVANRYMVLNNCCLKEINYSKELIAHNSDDVIKILRELNS